MSAEPIPTREPIRTTGFAIGAIRNTLRLEGLAILAVASVALWTLGAPWWLVAILFLAPDLAFLVYLVNQRAATVAYNIAHTYTSPVVLGLAAYFAGSQIALWVALIWAAHIGFDRAIGYGLKYSTGFGHTHLGLMGKDG